MRLIKAKTLVLEEFAPDKIPKYAILSHRWWGDDEVLLQDFGERAQSKRGWTKIKYSCYEALSDGLEYVWVDTCCIDKTSSSELSEAINSMFQWYERAEVCYAYLSDVTDRLLRTGDYSEFRQSRWFTRGWTLQELISPSKVIFFSNKWKKFGTKSGLASIVSSVTRVSEAVLTGAVSPFEESVARRMSWASKRETTRPEDIAYCLLGIFGINMPLLYGEGLRAFIRLQEEILKSCEDQTIFAWELSDGGREDEIAKAIDGLFASTPAWFAGSGDVIPFYETSRSSSYSLTNRGLEIELSLLHSDSRFWINGRIAEGHCYEAPLNCRKEASNQPLALRLHSQYVDALTFQPLGLYTRLKEVRLNDAVSITAKKVTVIRSSKFSPHADSIMSTGKGQNWEVFIFRGLSTFDFISVEPSSRWDAKQQCVFIPRDNEGNAHCAISFMQHDQALQLIIGYFGNSRNQNCRLQLKAMKENEAMPTEFKEHRYWWFDTDERATYKWKGSFWQYTVNATVSRQPLGSMAVWKVEIDSTFDR